MDSRRIFEDLDSLENSIGSSAVIAITPLTKDFKPMREAVD